MTTLGLIGVPTSAGAFAPGQERAPEALRAAGVVPRLRALGVSVHDHGDRASWAWRPDSESRRAQHAALVTEIVRETATRVETAARAGELTVVLGGDCTVGIGTVAGHVAAAGEGRVGLLYLDMHADLNVPDSVPEGALDWMGMAHMLGGPGVVQSLANVGSRTPLLDPAEVIVFGWEPVNATDHERAAIERLGLTTVGATDVAAAPAATARAAVDALAARCDRVLIHFDVDVIDFTDVPLSENTGRNQGVAYHAVLDALAAAITHPAVAGLTVTELNPAHAESVPGTVRRFAADLAQALSSRAGRDGLMVAPEPLLDATLRLATVADAAVAAATLMAFNAEFGEPAPALDALTERMRELLAGDDVAVLIAEHEGTVAGLAVMRFRLSIWTPGRECYLAELYVAPALRGRGLGRALMTAVIERARAEGADYMDLGTAETDVAARGLYESLGFDNHEGRPGGPVNYYYERML